MFRVLGLICAVLLTVVATPATADPTGGVPAGFAPSSTSWIDGKRGFVVGFAPCASGQCPALLRTVDGGVTWRQTRVPPVRLVSVDRRVRVHFANDLHGVITDGQAMYATHTGGRLWRRVVLPGDIGALASNDRALYAIVTSDTGTRLFSAPLDADRWAPVPGVELPSSGGGTVVAHGSGASVALNVIHESIAYWTTTNGQTWQASEPPCQVNANPELSLAGPTVFALCSYNPGRGSMFKDLMRSDSGGPFTFVSQAPEPGITTDFAAASPSTVAIGAIGAGAAWLHRGTQGPAAWGTPFIADELPLADLAFTGEQDGALVWGGPLWGEAKIYRTHDAGATWTPLTFA
jgi:hypothetical protein